MKILGQGGDPGQVETIEWGEDNSEEFDKSGIPISKTSGNKGRNYFKKSRLPAA